MSEFTIRPAVLDDAPQAELLLAELGYPIGDPGARARLELLLSARRVHTRVAAEAGSLLGLVSAQFVEMFAYRLIFVTVLVVKREARRRGVGAALMAAMDDFGRENGCEQTMGVVRSDLPENHRFFKGAGYTQAGIRFLRALPLSGGDV